MTPERAWKLMRAGVKRRLRANLTELMQQFEADDEPSFDRPGGAMRLADAEVRRATAAAQRCYDACRTEWEKQGRQESFDFFQAVYKCGIIPLLTEHKLHADRRFERLTARVNRGNSVSRRMAPARVNEITTARTRYGAGLAILRREWHERIQNDQRDCGLRKRLRQEAVKKGRIRKSGPKMTDRTREFRELAGRLRIDVVEDSQFRRDLLRPKKRSGNRRSMPKVSKEQLNAIAKRFDAEGFEPELYLEGKAARDTVAALNKDKKPTDDDYINWSKIATGRNRKLITAMRRTLSRSVEFVRAQSRT